MNNIILAPPAPNASTVLSSIAVNGRPLSLTIINGTLLLAEIELYALLVLVRTVCMGLQANCPASARI